MEIKMPLLQDLHFVGLEGPRTSFFDIPLLVGKLIHFITPGERQAG
jgi:hypothetical protein